MKITIPEFSLVILVGATGSGKSHFARRHFKPSEVISSDFCRGLVSDDENNQAATKDAFEVLQYIAAKRLAGARLTVIDATNVQMEARKPLLALAREYHCIPVAVVFDTPEKVCLERNRERPDRAFGRHVVAQQRSQLRRSLRSLKREGFRYLHVLESPEQVDAVEIERSKLWTNRREEKGPFDIIGDLHGCADELEALLGQLGYSRTDGTWIFSHPGGRRAIFLGDVVDRGPRIIDTYRIVKAMVEAGSALCVPGNHDMKLLRKLRGRDVKITHGLERTLEELAVVPEQARAMLMNEMAEFFDSLVSHFVLDEGNLVVAHAGMKEAYQGRASGRIRDFALYGETTGETDEFGLPIRYNWAADYRGKAKVVYGHTPVPEPEWLNHTINVDTGCVFGGKLSALRYPEREVVSVDAARVYYDPVRPLVAVTREGLTAQQTNDDLLDLEDVCGKRIVNTRLRPNITIREENATAALEAMSRFAVDPKWLIYLPPTMSPSETSKRPDLLEHPDEAFEYFRSRGVEQVICQEKHMGSRAIVIVCKDAAAARERFGIQTDGEDAAGICYTRTGRRFFEDLALERELLDRVRSSMERAGLWEELNTSWVCLDCELMPWSAKAQALLTGQYAAVGAAASAATSGAVSLLERAQSRGLDVDELLAGQKERQRMVWQYQDAYRGYCWPVTSISDLKLAPFHLLATEGAVHVDKDHRWHMETLSRLGGEREDVVHRTAYRLVSLHDTGSCGEAVGWWRDLTSRGGEGMVVKPLAFIATGRKGLVQPALKCRGREYLRIIYGPEYTTAANLERLRARGLSSKRSLAIREFALGLEALERFIRREPLRRIHECVFGVLALESEPVDPRL
ncbi:MAG TPA: polynucleotide kinase-phosphatase [Candidatus Polarisedimenticolia bacterium]|jgi:protein phosphatase